MEMGQAMLTLCMFARRRRTTHLRTPTRPSTGTRALPEEYLHGGKLLRNYAVLVKGRIGGGKCVCNLRLEAGQVLHTTDKARAGRRGTGRQLQVGE